MKTSSSLDIFSTNNVGLLLGKEAKSWKEKETGTKSNFEDRIINNKIRLEIGSTLLMTE